MALTSGQQWAVYLLMATHGNGGDDKSALRQAVEAAGPVGGDYQPSLVAALRQQVDPAFDGTGIAQLPDLSGYSLRHALALDQNYPGGGPCPATGDESTVYNRLKPLP